MTEYNTSWKKESEKFWVFDSKIETIDVALTFVGSSLSILGAIVLFLAHFLRWKIGKSIDDARKFLLCLTLADLGNAIGYLWGVARYVRSADASAVNVTACRIEQEPGCTGQSFVTTSFTMSSFFWTTLIALHLYSTYGVLPKRKTSCRRWAAYSLAGWGIPLSITITAVSLGKLGSDLSVGSGAWCWISACLSHNERTIWMTISGKGWEILMYLLCFACYILIKWEKIRKRRFMKKSSSLNVTLRYKDIKEDKEKGGEDDLRFLLLWMVEVVLRMFGTVRYIIAAVRRHTNNELPDYSPVDTWLLHLQSFGDSAQALCSCVLFCIFERDTRKLLIDTLACRRKHQNDERYPIVQKSETCV